MLWILGYSILWQPRKYTKPSKLMMHGLTGADSNPGAIHLQKQPQELFYKGGFVLRK